MTQRLFVTGLSGFVGKHLQAYLAAAHTPWALLPVPHRYDLLEPDSLGDLWPELPDAVIHLAGQTYVPEAFRDPARTLQINLLGTLNLLQALKAQGFSGTFLYISSGDVYGQVAEAALPIHEELIPHPRNPYAVSKLAAESLCLQWGITEGWRVLVARPFNHIGPGQKDSFVIASAARQIARIRTERTWPSCCWRRATGSTAWWRGAAATRAGACANWGSKAISSTRTATWPMPVRCSAR